MMDEKTARLVEIFSSVQGEGPRVGERMTFVRFESCRLRCRWCDTPESFGIHKTFRVEARPFSGDWERHDNPVSQAQLEGFVAGFKDPFVSLTGGEPLQQVDFLKSWLPEASERFKFLLETGGFLPQALEKLIPWIHTVSMDIKLPSSAQTGEFWEEHGQFLRLAIRCKECYVKIVLTEDTREEDLSRALNLIRSVDPKISLILQPASVTKTFRAPPSSKQLGRFYDLAREKLEGVRVIPQVHKMLGVS